MLDITNHQSTRELLYFTSLGVSLINNDFLPTNTNIYESRNTLKSLSLLLCQNYLEIEYGSQPKIQPTVLKIICRGSRSPDNAEFGHFTLLLCKGRQRNVLNVLNNWFML